MWRAAELFNEFGTLLIKNISKSVYDSIELMMDKIEINTLQFIANTYVNRKENYRSTASLRINTTSGYTSFRRVMSENFSKTNDKYLIYL